MNLSALVAELQARGVRLIADGDSLRYRGPQGALTPELRAEVAAHKPGLLVLAGAPRADDAAAILRAQLACGCLYAYGALWLADGSWVRQPAAYCRAKLADLENPRLVAEALRRLQLLRDALAAMDARAGYLA